MAFPGGNNRSLPALPGIEKLSTYINSTDGSPFPWGAVLPICLATALAGYFILERAPWASDGTAESMQKQPSVLRSLLLFCYSCFLKPHEKSADGSQQGALESFYKSQAGIYDATRTVLLKGREDMLTLVAAQMQYRAGLKKNAKSTKPVWVDVGGGTGWNIEEMARHLDVEAFFEHVFLVDFSPSLCAIARERFARLGWKNVTVICEDAREFTLEDYQTSGDVTKPSRAALVTMSYSLSMIPDFHSVIDSIQKQILAPDGLMGVVDFYVQSALDVKNRSYVGGILNRHVGMLGRVFWRTWFDFDRVYLEPARRDYLEYRFGTVASVSDRNKTLGYIPYYIWLGTQKDLLAQPEANEGAAATAKANQRAEVPLPSYFYQNQHWRQYYNDGLPKHTQFHDEYIYAFTWEDVAIDHDILDVSASDEILAITSAGDNLLSYLRASPAKVHAVDLNPSQNHLLELKVAAYCSLPYEDFWKIFGDGKHPEFRHLLLSKLSPYLSSRALQYWYANATIFTHSPGGLYDTGGSRHGIRIFHWITRLFFLRGAVSQVLAPACSLETQRKIWQTRIRPVLLSPLVSRFIVSQPAFLWTALGVPKNQLALIEADHTRATAVATPGGSVAADHSRSHAIWNYMVDTLDPVLAHDRLATQNPYYHVCLARHFSPACHPDYLSKETFAALAGKSAQEAFFREKLRIHTDEVRVVLAGLPAGSLTIAVLMDSMDWFDPPAASATVDAATAADAQVELLYRALKPGGRVLIRSAGLRPWYLDVFSRRGFRAECHGARGRGQWIDRVNMYASCWVMVKGEE